MNVARHTHTVDVEENTMENRLISKAVIMQFYKVTDKDVGKSKQIDRTAPVEGLSGINVYSLRIGSNKTQQLQYWTF